MSELAFDEESNPFQFSHRTKKLRPRRWQNAGQRGTCAAVLDADGAPVLIDAGAEYIELRAAVGNVPGFYWLEQCDDHGDPIEDAPPAFISIEPSRKFVPIGEVDSRDAILRDLAQATAEVVRMIVERFGNGAAADTLGAAPGAGVSRRQEEESESTAHSNPFGPFQPLIEMAMPHLPKLGAFLWMKLQELTRQIATTAPAAAAAPAEPAPEPGAAPAAASHAPPAPAPVITEPTASAPVTVATSMPPTTTANGHPALEGPTPSTAAMADTPTEGDGQNDRPHDASGAAHTAGAHRAPPVLDPTPERWAHWLAIQERLTPWAKAVAALSVERMPPEMRAEWLAEMWRLDVDRAAAVVHSIVPEDSPRSPPAASSSNDDAGNGGSSS